MLRTLRVRLLILLFGLSLASLVGTNPLTGVSLAHATLSTTASSAVSTGTGFDGLNEVQAYGNYVPPDVQIATGPNHVMEAVNLARAVYDKQGTLLLRQSLKNFFHTGKDFISDPKVLYDSPSGRWFATILDVDKLNPITRSNVLVAVSTSNDPTGSWKIYNTISTGGHILPDQPVIGINDDKFVVSFNKFNFTSGNYLGAQWYVLHKGDLVAGVASPRFQFFGPDPALESVHPVTSLSSTSTEFMVSTGGQELGQSTSTVKLFSVAGVPPSATTSPPVSLTVQVISMPPAGQEPQPPCPNPPCPILDNSINTDDFRVLSTAWYRGKLWLGLNNVCRPGGTIDSACVRLIQIDTSSSTIAQDFDHGRLGEDFFYPALTIDNMGNLDLIYGFSSSGTKPSIAVTGQAVNDPIGSLAPAKTIKSGTAVEVSGRYGDYFGAALDPVDPTIAWVAGEYMNSAIGDCGYLTPCWSTFVNQMRLLPTIFIDSTSTFNGTTIRTTGTIRIDTPLTSLTLSGWSKVVATNPNTGVELFNRNYTVTPLVLSPGSVYQVMYLLNVEVDSCGSDPVYYCRLSSNVQISFTGSAITVDVQVSRNVDINLNGTVDQPDADINGAAFGSTPGSPNWNPQADLDADNDVDIVDAAHVAFYFQSKDFI